jgi:hypothetical protein
MRCPHVQLRAGGHPLAVAGLGEAVGVAFGDHDVGVVHEPVDRGGGDGGREDLVEAAGVDVARDRDRPAFVGGVDDPEQRFGGFGRHGEQPDVVDHDEVGFEDPFDGLGDRVIRAVAGDELAEGFDGEPRDREPVVDRGVAERFEQPASAPRRTPLSDRFHPSASHRHRQPGPESRPITRPQATTSLTSLTGDEGRGAVPGTRPPARGSPSPQSSTTWARGNARYRSPHFSSRRAPTSSPPGPCWPVSLLALR